MLASAGSYGASQPACISMWSFPLFFPFVFLIFLAFYYVCVWSGWLGGSDAGGRVVESRDISEMTYEAAVEGLGILTLG